MSEWRRVRLYRFTHANGTAKDWAICHDGEGVHIYYGKTDRVLRTVTIPQAGCRDGSPATEARTRERRKTAAGYHALGEYELNQDNQRQLRPVSEEEPASRPDDNAALSPQAPPSCLYWERCPRKAADGAQFTRHPSRALHDAALAIAERLTAVGLLRGSAVEAFRDGRWVLHLVLDTDATWSFGYAEPPQAGYLNRDGSGSGIIVDMLRYPAVTLFILALAKVDPSFVVANETGEVVTAPPETLAVDRDVLIALGLVPRSLRELLAVRASTDGDWFF